MRVVHHQGQGERPCLSSPDHTEEVDYIMKRILIAAAAIAMATAAFAAPATMTEPMGAGKVLADAKGMVLYVYDKDTKGAAASACTGGWWRPCGRLLNPGRHRQGKADGDWTIVNGVDKDGKTAVKQWAFKGLPVYYYVKDAKAGDATGDAVGGTWHVIKQ